MKFLLPIIIVLVVITGGYLAVNQSFRQKTIPPSQTVSPRPISQELKTFHSKLMKFSIELPNNFSVEEKFGSVIIATNDGTISIGQNATNFTNLEDHIKNSRNNLESRLSNKTTLSVNGLETISGFLEEEKIYFIYVDYNVYLISTESTNLYDNLDQIAQSFRYIP